jgi:2-dehydropantoate 2-reductase
MVSSEAEQAMRIAILGAGGIGGYYGGMLARAGHDVHLLARGENLAALRQKGLEVRAPDESFVVPVKAGADVQQFGSVDFAVVAVKTYSLAEVAPAAQHLAQGGALILPLLNGVDIADRMVELGIPRENMLGGVTTISVVRIAPGIFERRSQVQKVVIGELQDLNPASTNDQGRTRRVEQIAQAFREIGADTQVSADIRAEIWRKFAFIASMAATCGLARSPLGSIRATPLGRLLLERAIREVVSVARARGIVLAGDEVDRIIKFCDTLPDALKPSLLLDLEARRRTEIDDLSGAVSRIGRLAGIETPIHDTAAAALSAAEQAGRCSSELRSDSPGPGTLELQPSSTRQDRHK